MIRPVVTLPTAEAAAAADLFGAAVLVLDVLRATTTLAWAFENGATMAFVAADIPAALRLADEWSHAGVLLCGERGGRKIPGFDLGNSPLEYTREAVGGRPLVFSSTNGSRALLAARACERLGLGALVNARAAALWAAAGPEPLVLLCSGKEGEESEEDLLGAGAILAELEGLGEAPRLDPTSRRALSMFRSAEAGLEAAVARCEHAVYLAREGFGADLKVAAALNSLRRVPEWESGRLGPGREWPQR